MAKPHGEREFSPNGGTPHRGAPGGQHDPETRLHPSADIFGEELLVCRETFRIKHRRVFPEPRTVIGKPMDTAIIVDRTPAASRTPANREICHPPSPAKTMDSGKAGGTYTVTWRSPSYSNVPVTSCQLRATLARGSY